MFRVAVLSLTLPILASSVAWSQEPATREEADRQRREQQAKEVKPYEPNRVERAIDFAEDKASLHPRPRGLPSKVWLVDHGQRVRLWPGLS